MIQYQTFELEFSGPAPVGSLALADIGAKFTCDDKITEVKGFYAGNDTYKVRFYPSLPGNYHWEVSGVVNACGDEVCTPATGSHGMVKAENTYFKYEDGTYYHPFGTTIYALVHQEDELIAQTMRTLKAAPFNKVRFCVFPKHYDYNHNDPEIYPFEKVDGKWDVHQPCLEYWDKLDMHLASLRELGIEADLILFHPYDHWGFSELSKDECMTYLDYLVRRLSAVPNVWWSLANEYDLMEHFEPQWWYDFAQFLHENDKFGHLLSNHNWITHWDFANPYTTHCCIQGGGVDQVPKLKKQFGKPVIFDECGYEGNLMHGWGNLSAFEMVHRIWTAVAGGGYCTHGETFANTQEVLWWSKGGVLHGQSPKRIEFLRNMIEGLPGPLCDTLGGGFFDDMTPEKIEEIKKDPQAMERLGNVGRCIIALPDKVREELFAGFAMPASRRGEDVYLRYLGKQCTAEVKMELPEAHQYKVEVVDIWEMTRVEAAYGVCGEVSITLPGKEGMAVLATRID